MKRILDIFAINKVYGYDAWMYFIPKKSDFTITFVTTPNIGWKPSKYEGMEF